MNKVAEVELSLDVSDLEYHPDYGGLMTLGDFIDYCKAGMFEDYDGIGYYSTGKKMSHSHPAQASEIMKGNIDIRWPYVMWFNMWFNR